MSTQAGGRRHNTHVHDCGVSRLLGYDHFAFMVIIMEDSADEETGRRSKSN